ncbi:hypothetical protein AAMO2058_001593900, partial [Amorphochlora amoebiformis]
MLAGSELRKEHKDVKRAGWEGQKESVNPSESGNGVYYSKTSDLNREVLKKLPLLHSEDCWYRPPSWLSDRHVHTIFASKARKGPKLRYKRVMLKTADGGEIALDIVKRESKNEEDALDKPGTSLGNKWILLIPGLGGGSEDSYVRSMASSLGQNGYRVAILNMRGCGNSPISSPRLFSAYRGSVEDMRLAVSYIRGVAGAAEKARGSGKVQVGALGWSCGASITTNFAGSQGEYPYWERIDAAAALACPFDLVE